MPDDAADMPGPAPWLNVRTKGCDRTLPSGAEYRIGRGPYADIVLNDHRLARQHVVLRSADGTWVLEDCGSANGTFAGTERVSWIEIRAVVVVRLGHPDDGVLVRFQPVPGGDER